MYFIRKVYFIVLFSSIFSFLELMHTAWQLFSHFDNEKGSNKEFEINYFLPNFNVNYETERRAISRALFEENQQYSKELSKIRKSSINFVHSEKLDKVEKIVRNHYIETSALLDDIKTKDGLQNKRIETLKKLTQEVYENIETLQNPKNCQNVDTLICQGRMNSRNTQICGWGCMIHFAAKCFQAAYSTGLFLHICLACLLQYFPLLRITR